ncbi:hypothetical protein [Streptodolium elevatio]|uniref:Uncharacterized protein n=1 Tax=Streptodolium elevatio TaxID=3157996 RepID=A0ABV3DQ88_9ACTN
MTDPATPPGADAHYLTHTARLYGWTVAAHHDGSVRMSLPDRTVWAHFAPDGSFRYGRATGPHSSDAELDMRQVLDVLEKHGMPTPPSPRLP